MVTKEQACTSNMFHENETCKRWRRNGETQTWKTRPDDFRTPIKHGLYRYGQLTQDNASLVHTEADCPNKKQ